ncbi:MAG: hypothetical protein ACR2O0_16470 [Rhizobiaceae bacterium]
MQFQEIVVLTEKAGFIARGGFNPCATDLVPDVAEGVAAQTLILVGNAGNSMWNVFAKERDPRSDLLDDWTRGKLEEIAEKSGAAALFPFTRPYHPFQRWAQKAEDCHMSPIGIAIHPDYGLWHAYRGALAFSERIEIPHIGHRPSPCISCADKPCLSACPVEAFQADTYNVPACISHLATSAGNDCMSGGCLARHACPVGRDYVYSGEQANFLMSAFLDKNGR